MSTGEVLANVTRAANDMAREIEALRKELADWHGIRSALDLILKHGDMSDTVRQEIALLISDEPGVDGAGRTYESYQPAATASDATTGVEEYPGELAHLRDLLRAVGRLADKQPEGNPVTELLIDHYSDSRMVDAQLAKCTCAGCRVHGECLTPKAGA
ncbi:hypothetical protein [Streptomyces sp. NPDC002889]|uniref:hypothetical protein n=1 Tax=Streptomyces sp. NPDC002889 TaxID=3364669 RepID=UPI0036788695